MTQLVTSQLVESHQQCPRKAFFLLRGSPPGHPHDYEVLIEERAMQRRLAHFASGLAKTETENKRSEFPLVLTARDLQASCDGVIDGNKHGAKEPFLVIGTKHPSSSNKTRLAFAGYVLGEDNRRRPAFGVIVPFIGDPARVKLDPLYRAIGTTINQLRDLKMRISLEPPSITIGKQCQTCEFRNHCCSEAERSDSLFLLERMTPKLVARYHKKGIFTVTQLSYVYRPRRRRKGLSDKVSSLFNVELQALAIREKKIYLHERPSLPQHSVEMFLDMEGIPDQGFDYLIGVVVKQGDKSEMHSFWADTPDGESHIFAKFVDLSAKYPDTPIYHYGSYERRVIERVAERYAFDCKAILRRLVNVNGMIYGKVYFPARSNNLKDLGAVLGAHWPTPNPSGLESIVWRYRWEDLGQNGYKEKLLAYNEADCNALRILTAELQSLSKTADSRDDVDFADKPKQLATLPGKSIHQALEGIIISAHEDYGRRKICLTQTMLGSTPTKHERRHQSRITPTAMRHFPKRVSKTICVPRSRKCSQRHNGPLLPMNEITEHCLIDLEFTQRGCHKKILKYYGRNAYCPSCKRAYPPPAIRKLHYRIFGHAFQAWAVYQRVAMRLPYLAISQSSEVLFSEPINESSITYFMRQLATEYAPTERLFINHILGSPFAHVDETKLNIKGTAYYAWVVTDGKHVVFRLTPTRETTEVQKMLEGYSGVLISDFYAGYDSMPCRQQKCLVHLIRDLNEDLWKNPFLAEYELFVGRARDLLVSIFADVERYGLKARYLRKHIKSVDRFYRQSIERVTWESDVVQKYQKRFLRYREPLFLFLTEDGIPWNNNMGERALRHLAIQRKISGSFCLRGANDYLRLLGIAQSCRFQNKLFLRFLLSKERDVDVFKDRKRRGSR